MSLIILRTSLILAAIFAIVPANPIGTEEELQENRYPMVSSAETKVSSQAIASKTSSLLAEALQMIHNAKDAKERKWLESFVHRLARLASELEQEKLAKTLKTQEKGSDGKEAKAGAISSTFASHSSKEEPSFLTSVSAEYQDSKDATYSAAPPEEKDDIFDIDLQQVPEKSEVTPQSHLMSLQKQVPLRLVPSMIAIAETGSTTPSLHPVQLQRDEEDLSMREDLVKEIIAKMHKLRDMGATNDEMMDILKRSQFPTGLPKTTAEFEEEEEGAAAGELEPDDITDISTLAPSLGQIGSNDISASQPSVGQKNDEDDLVKQLEEEKFILVNTVSTDTEEEALRRVESSVNEDRYH